MPGWDLYDLVTSYMFTWMGSVRSAGSAICPRVIVIHQYLEYHASTGIIIGTRTVRVLYDTGATYDMTALPWWLPILVAADQVPMHTLPNSTSTESRGAEAKHNHKHKHSRCRGQQLYRLVDLRPKMISAAGSKEVPLRILESIRSNHFCRTCMCSLV